MTLLHLVPGPLLDTYEYRGYAVELYADEIHDRLRLGNKVGYKITDPEGIPVEAANGLSTRADALDPEGWIRHLIEGQIQMFIEDRQDWA